MNNRSNITLSLIAGGLALVVCCAVAGWLLLQRAGDSGKASAGGRTVIVFASTDDDGAAVAGVVALVAEGGTKVTFPDPLTEVSIPGTSYDRLRDAYSFGGAAGVGAALGMAPTDAWVDVAEAEWVAALAAAPSEGASGPPGIGVELPRPVDAFDGRRLVSFPKGASVVRPADVPLLLRGAAYLPVDARSGVAKDVGTAVMRAMAERSGAGATTNLSAEDVAALWRELRAP